MRSFLPRIQLCVCQCDLVVHAGFAGAAVAGAALAALDQINGIVDIVLKQSAVALELVEGQLFKGLVLCDAVGHHAAGQLVGIAEGHPLLGEVVGAVGGVDKALGGGAAHVDRNGLHGIQQWG